jgi:hypothetical protein
VSSVLSFDGTKLNDTSGEISITDVTGRAIAQYTMPASKKLIVNTSGYPAGLYFYHLAQGSTSQTGKFVVAH